jgi:hypothetical protein
LGKTGPQHQARFLRESADGVLWPPVYLETTEATLLTAQLPAETIAALDDVIEAARRLGVLAGPLQTPNFSRRSVARKFNVCIRAVQRWERQGILLPARKINRRAYYTAESVEAAGRALSQDK